MNWPGLLPWSDLVPLTPGSLCPSYTGLSLPWAYQLNSCFMPCFFCCWFRLEWALRDLHTVVSFTYSKSQLRCHLRQALPSPLVEEIPFHLKSSLTHYPTFLPSLSHCLKMTSFLHSLNRLLSLLSRDIRQRRPEALCVLFSKVSPSALNSADHAVDIQVLDSASAILLNLVSIINLKYFLNFYHYQSNDRNLYRNFQNNIQKRCP